MLIKGNLVLNQTKSQETVGSNSSIKGGGGGDSAKKKTVTFEDTSSYLSKVINLEKNV